MIFNSGQDESQTKQSNSSRVSGPEIQKAGKPEIQETAKPDTCHETVSQSVSEQWATEPVSWGTSEPVPEEHVTKMNWTFHIYDVCLKKSVKNVLIELAE